MEMRFLTAEDAAAGVVVTRAGGVRLEVGDCRGAFEEGIHHAGEQVLLSVTSTQTAALVLYRSLGFELFGTEPRALNFNGEFIDEHYLVLGLK